MESLYDTASHKMGALKSRDAWETQISLIDYLMLSEPQLNWGFFFFFEKQTYTHTQGREKEVLKQRHTTKCG